jgi:predicted NBD/HSP70 family sugar kinase
MSTQAPWLLGLDLGGTRLKALCLTPDGREIARSTTPTGGGDWQDSVKSCVGQLLVMHGQPAAIGVAAPGLPSKDERCIAHMPGRLPGLEGLDWQTTIRDLAAGIASFINILDPEAVVIGGGIAEAGDALFIPLAAELERMEWRPNGHRVEILRATLGDWAGATGAAFYSIQNSSFVIQNSPPCPQPPISSQNPATSSTASPPRRR